MPLSILSNNGFRKAVVDEDADGVAVSYYRIDSDGKCRLDRTTRPALPFHAALDLATQIVNCAPPKVGGRL